MAQIEIVSEHEGSVGWVFDAQVLDDEGSLRRHEIRLSWADYNLWSGAGADEPAEVADAVLRFMLSQTSAGELRASFDASIVRRLYAQADQAIPSFIHDV